MRAFEVALISFRTRVIKVACNSIVICCEKVDDMVQQHWDGLP